MFIYLFSASLVSESASQITDKSCVHDRPAHRVSLERRLGHWSDDGGCGEADQLVRGPRGLRCPRTEGQEDPESVPAGPGTGAATRLRLHEDPALPLGGAELQGRLGEARAIHDWSAAKTVCKGTKVNNNLSE